MVFEQIEQLKREYTDKYVVVDESRPELVRFKGLTGTVKTVNMNGRALVEFDGHNNIGWYDIDPAFLKVIDKPLPKPELKAKAKAAPKAAPKAPAKAAGAVKKPAPGGAGMSVEEILAAARGKKAAGGKPEAKEAAKPAEAPKAAKPAPGGKGMSVEEILAAARAEKQGGGAKAAAAAPQAPAEAPAESAAQAESASATPKRMDPSKMSVEEILAAARAEKQGGAAAPAAELETPVAETTAETTSEEASSEPSATPAESAKAGSSEPLPTDVEGIIAYCRRVDGQG